jgi:hypothetical protein
MMARIAVLFLLSLSILAGCTKKEKIKGKEIVPREVLVDVLVDIHLVDGITNDRKFYRRFEGVDSVDLLGPIFDKYGINREKFDRTMLEYTQNPILLDKVYNDVIMKLNVMLDQNDKEEKTETQEMPSGIPGL